MNKANRKGAVIIYVTMSLTTLVGFCSLAVDYGRAQLIKTELRRAADSAARSAALGITNNTSVADALDIAQRNLVDGTKVVLQPADVEMGNWDTTAHRFTPRGTPINAARVTALRTNARGNPISMMFASAIGFSKLDVKAVSVAMLVTGVSVNQNIQATANPFLAGMPAGSIASQINPHNNPDHAGTSGNLMQSPTSVTMPIIGGASYTFDAISGTAGHDPHLSSYQPDGQLTDIGHNNLTTSGSNSYGSQMYSQNGIADMTAPINALVGIFLDDNAPNTTATPASLDFSTYASRDFGTLKPQLKQIFFIGDGLNSGGAQQQFVAPKGATRMFLATWDFYEWNNNYGFRNVQVNRPPTVVTVQ